LALIYGLTLTNLNIKNSFTDLVTLAEASLNNIVLLSAAFFFIITLENRLKRMRANKYLNEIKGFAHVVDMYQLTKNPQLIGREKRNTEHSPKREMTKFEMQRYLDYSSEFLSLIGKVAALYSQSLPDEVVMQTSRLKHLQKVFNLKITYLCAIILIFQKKTKIMGKSKDAKKAVKKEATKTLKEKRAEKKAKKRNA